ncbi:MAG: methyltransferase domain-containing protein [Saprospiraceae bacterium]
MFNLLPSHQSWQDFPIILDRYIKNLAPDAVVVEIGGGANPSLTVDQVKGRQYIVIDIDEVELDKAKGDHFVRVVADIARSELSFKADFIFSKMLLEHVPNPQDFHKGIFDMLKNGGSVLHFYATLYNPASIANLLMPEKLSKILLYCVQKRNWHTDGKFQAYYRWSFGPTPKQIIRFESIGFKITYFNGYIGSRYLQQFTYIKHIENIYNKVISKINSPFFCSNAIIVLLK